MKKIKKREFFPYQFLKIDKLNNLNITKDLVSLENLEKNLNNLPNNEFFMEFKINCVLKLKWYFDYLNNYLKNPNDIKKVIKEINLEIALYKNLYLSNWIKKEKKIFKKNEKWLLTKKSFDFMWKKNTNKKFDFNNSKVIVEPRIKQILSMMPKNYIDNKKILDSGCGPGRYIEIIKKYKPSHIYGVDSGSEIIKQNKKRFKNKYINFKRSDFKKLPFKNNFFDFIISAGVLHHSNTNIETLIKEHYRTLKKNGFLFIFIKSTGGYELKLWKFYRSVFNKIPIRLTTEHLENKINSLRLQGFLDHCYGEYKEISRKKFELILKKYFKNIYRVPGIQGADVTPELYKKDKYFRERFGDGDLRYLLQK